MKVFPTMSLNDQLQITLTHQGSHLVLSPPVPQGGKSTLFTVAKKEKRIHVPTFGALQPQQHNTPRKQCNETTGLNFQPPGRASGEVNLSTALDLKDNPLNRPKEAVN